MNFDLGGYGIYVWPAPLRFGSADSPAGATVALFDLPTAQAIIANVADPKDPKAVKTFLETTPIKSIQTLKFSPEDHVGLGKDGVAIVEFKNGVWVEAAGIK
jgi:hypothetical protein